MHDGLPHIMRGSLRRFYAGGDTKGTSLIRHFHHLRRRTEKCSRRIAADRSWTEPRIQLGRGSVGKSKGLPRQLERSGHRKAWKQRITLFQLHAHANLFLITHASRFDERIGNKSLTVAVLGEHRAVPHRVVHAQANEPTEQQVVVDPFHQQPLRADGEEDLQQEGPQNVLRSNRRPSRGRIQPFKLVAQRPQHRRSTAALWAMDDSPALAAPMTLS